MAALCTAVQPTFAADISNDCGDMAKAMPNKIGNLPLVKKFCTTVSAAGAKSIGTYPSRYITATYEGKTPKQSIKVTLKDQRNDPDQVLKGTALSARSEY